MPFRKRLMRLARPVLYVTVKQGRDQLEILESISNTVLNEAISRVDQAWEGPDKEAFIEHVQNSLSIDLKSAHLELSTLLENTEKAVFDVKEADHRASKLAESLADDFRSIF